MVINGDYQGALESHRIQADLALCAGDHSPDSPGLSDPIYEMFLFDSHRALQHVTSLFVSTLEDAKGALEVLPTRTKRTTKKGLTLLEDARVEHCSSRDADISLKNEGRQPHDAYRNAIGEGYLAMIICPDGVAGNVLKVYYEGTTPVV